MTKNQNQPTFDLGRAIKKFFLSGFVVFTFIAYAVHERFTNPDAVLNPTSEIPSAIPQQTFGTPNSIPSATNEPSVMDVPPATAVPLPTGIPPTATPQPTATSNAGIYKDGVYTGPQVDAYWGIVEVQVTVQNGSIANVQFLKYPSDRRTSKQINNIAMPYLQQEALQAQSAHINIISGATFTSQGFAISLNAALQSAKN